MAQVRSAVEVPNVVSLFARAFHKARGDDRYVQFATVGVDQFPRCRTVVLRSIVAEEGLLRFVTDGRSEKLHELRATGSVAEVCWYVRPTREQFRFRGSVHVHDALAGNSALRKEHWNALSPDARATFHWPAPGSPLQQATGVEIPAVLEEPPETFLLLELVADQVDYLALGSRPHVRAQYARKARNWFGQAVWP